MAFSAIIGESILALYVLKKSIFLTHDSANLFVKDYVDKVRKNILLVKVSKKI